VGKAGDMDLGFQVMKSLGISHQLQISHVEVLPFAEDIPTLVKAFQELNSIGRERCGCYENNKLMDLMVCNSAPVKSSIPQSINRHVCPFST
jgi:hypothetical protein